MPLTYLNESSVLHAAYASSMKRARQMGSLTGYALQSSKISSPAVQGSFRLHESIIG